MIYYSESWKAELSNEYGVWGVFVTEELSKKTPWKWGMKLKITYFRYLACVLFFCSYYDHSLTSTVLNRQSASTMANMPPLRPPEAAAALHTRHFCHRRALRMPSSNISVNSSGCNTSVWRTHTITNNNVCADFTPWRFLPAASYFEVFFGLPANPNPNNVSMKHRVCGGWQRESCWWARSPLFIINRGHFRLWLHRGPLELHTDHSSSRFCCEGPQQSTIGVWFEKEGSGVCSASQTRANTEVSIFISFYVIMMVMSLQITRLFTLFFQHKFNSPLRSYIQSQQYKTRGFKETQAIDRLFVDSFHFLWVSLSLSPFNWYLCYLSCLHHR
jgi:hypothetical protein